MNDRRTNRNDDHPSSESLFPVIAAESLRAGSVRPHHTEPARGGEEKMSLFWRIFGGTILSIVALVVITAYQSISGSIQDLRTGQAHLNEAKAELVKKDEYAASRTKTWDRISELQKEIAAVGTPMNQLKDRVAGVEEQSKTMAAERKENHELQATIKERVAQLDQQLSTLKSGQKEMQLLQQSMTALQEKSLLRDQQLKHLEDERKELLKEIQTLRERLARVEATKETRPVPAKPASTPKATTPDDPDTTR